MTNWSVVGDAGCVWLNHGAGDATTLPPFYGGTFERLTSSIFVTFVSFCSKFNKNQRRTRNCGDDAPPSAGMTDWRFESLEDADRGGNKPMIHSLIDACEYIRNDQGDPQTSFWLASQIMETRLWRCAETGVRRVLNADIKTLGERSRFVKIAEDTFALRWWVDGGPSPEDSR